MGTKKEAAKEKAIKGGMPTDVADNIFRMQMNDPSRTQNTPGIFKAKDQKVMAMSTMYNTTDPDGETVTSIRQDEFEVPRYMGSPEFQSAFGAADKAGLSVFEFPKGSGKMFTTEKGPATETHYLESVDTDTFKADSNQPAFDQGFDSSFKPNLPEVNLQKFNYKKKGDSKPGMVDTFTSYDTRQAARKAIIEGRKAKQAAIREARAEMKANPNINRKEFRKKKKAAKLAQAKARTEAMKKITAQGEAQRSAGKNPATSTEFDLNQACLLYTSPSPRDGLLSRMPSSA